jgi:hypothetical protein
MTKARDKKCHNCEEPIKRPGADYCDYCAGVPLMLRRFFRKKKEKR